MTYHQKLQRAVTSSNSLLCVGLDPLPERIPAPLRERFPEPAQLLAEFCRRVIQATQTTCCAYKPNLAFFEAYGTEGWHAFERVLDAIPSNKIVIADAKRGDIGTTAARYRTAFFDRLGVDAITLNPLMGLDTLAPYLNAPERGVYVLALTSNPGAADFLNREDEPRPLSVRIADALQALQNDSETTLGMVVGATQTARAQQVVDAFTDAPLLIPGIGAQGGRVDDLERLLAGHRGIPLISSSRSILYAGQNEPDWEERVARAAQTITETLTPITERYA
ncbi:MAG: orotidine-5'-phosphate decarboxylase [Balneolaceae bacterium]